MCPSHPQYLLLFCELMRIHTSFLLLPDMEKDFYKTRLKPKSWGEAYESVPLLAGQDKVDPCLLRASRLAPPSRSCETAEFGTWYFGCTLPLCVNEYSVDHKLEQVPKTTRQKEGCIGMGLFRCLLGKVLLFMESISGWRKGGSGLPFQHSPVCPLVWFLVLSSLY